MFSYDTQYKNILGEILYAGYESKDRTGVGTMAIFDANLNVSLKSDSDRHVLALLGLRKVYPRSMWYELFWMLSGSTDATFLQDKNISIWDEHSSREFLDSRGLQHEPEGSIGRGYGTQFRDFNGVDQLKELLIGLVENPSSRRHFISLWNPADLDKCALPPCHVSYNFMVTGDYLNLKFFQRSSDFVLAGNANFTFASFFLSWVAQKVGLRVGSVAHSITNCHVYTNHLPVAAELLDRDVVNHTATFVMPDSGVRFTDRDSIERLLDYEIELMKKDEYWAALHDSLDYESHERIDPERLIIAI